MGIQEALDTEHWALGIEIKQGMGAATWDAAAGGKWLFSGDCQAVAHLRFPQLPSRTTYCSYAFAEGAHIIRRCCQQKSALERCRPVLRPRNALLLCVHLAARIFCQRRSELLGRPAHLLWQ